MVATYHSRRIPQAARDILSFWFGRARNYSPALRERWFVHTPQYDYKVRALFGDVFEQAVAGELPDWENHPDTNLALVLLFDQVPRSLYRHSARAHATEERALKVARHALQMGYDQEMLPLRRLFFYLPFAHSPRPEDQAQSEVLFRQLVEEDPRMEEAVATAMAMQPPADIAPEPRANTRP